MFSATLSIFKYIMALFKTLLIPSYTYSCTFLICIVSSKNHYLYKDTKYKTNLYQIVDCINLLARDTYQLSICGHFTNKYIPVQLLDLKSVCHINMVLKSFSPFLHTVYSIQLSK